MSVGFGVTQTASGTVPGSGSTSSLDGFFKGIITDIGTGTISVKFLSHTPSGGTETEIDYSASGVYRFNSSSDITAVNNSAVGVATVAVNSVSDWFDSQTITTTNGAPISWNQIAERPGTSAYAAARNSRFDEVHVVVIDDLSLIHI